MNNICFIISKKEHELRRAVILEDLINIKYKENIFFESGYGVDLGFSDEDIKRLGFNIAFSEDIYNFDILIDPKIGDSSELDKMKNKIVFGWIHATQNYDITQKFIDNKITGYAWEKMYENSRHVFSENNCIAGKAGVMHAMLYYGSTFEGKSIAILGNGNTSKGVQDFLNKLKVPYIIFSRNDEQKLRNNIRNFDVIINCILWDPNRTDHIIYKDDLLKMKKNSMIVDISCDYAGGIESSIPTTIENPVYSYNGVLHYVVDHTPSLLYREATSCISKEVVKYLDDLITCNDNKILNDALIIKNGMIIDEEINKVQNRRVLTKNEKF